MSGANSAQQEKTEGRGKALGYVRGKDKKAWVGAIVHLISWPLANNGLTGTPDILESRTDARGRFSAQILIGRGYTVWAQSEPDEHGALRATQVAENVQVQVPMMLEERKKTLAPRSFDLSNRKSWAEYEPLHFRFIDLTANQRVVELTVEDETCTVPPFVGNRAVLRVTGSGAKGRVVPICEHSIRPNLDYLQVFKTTYAGIENSVSK